jgi:hypothetical protein
MGRRFWLPGKVSCPSTERMPIQAIFHVALELRWSMGLQVLRIQKRRRRHRLNSTRRDGLDNGKNAGRAHFRCPLWFKHLCATVKMPQVGRIVFDDSFFKIQGPQSGDRGSRAEITWDSADLPGKARVQAGGLIHGHVYLVIEIGSLLDSPSHRRSRSCRCPLVHAAGMSAWVLDVRLS